MITFETASETARAMSVSAGSVAPLPRANSVRAWRRVNAASGTAGIRRLIHAGACWLTDELLTSTGGSLREGRAVVRRAIRPRRERPVAQPLPRVRPE